MRTFMLFLAAFLISSQTASAHAADQPPVLPLYPGAVPGEAAPIAAEVIKGEQGKRQISNVSQPNITVYLPPKEKNTGAAIVIAPGGGYSILAIDHEGYDVAKWLNSIGVAGIVLKYRVPKRSEHPSRPLMDAQRAMSIVRSKAGEWHIDPKKIGLMGFSAGGHLAAVASTSSDKRAYPSIDAADQVGCRPDFSVYIYPGGIFQPGSEKLIPQIQVSKESPPAFLAVASDDRGSSDQTVQLYLALKHAGVPAELHVFATGGHGFGIFPGKLPANRWPARLEEWLQARKILERTTSRTSE
ncbi:MAG TPA: alpha/beta hydrolase [Gemmataceae bacterium]|jgi:acetyl esterase/lipase|nr:alpha/beta hydrolase [Gemmataceae bacterium]